MLASLAGPLPDLIFCPTGGIGAQTAGKYLALSNVACVGGSWMVAPALLAAQDFGKVEEGERLLAGEEFQSWKLKVSPDHTAILTCEDGNGGVVFTKANTLISRLRRSPCIS